jgi:hypothetical protein
VKVALLCPAGITTDAGFTWSVAELSFWMERIAPAAPAGCGSVIVPVSLLPTCTEELGSDTFTGPPTTLNALLTADCKPGLDAISVYPIPGWDSVRPGNQPELVPVHTPVVAPFSSAPLELFPRLIWMG